MSSPEIDRARYESFGGIISCTDPPFLAWVDQQFMQKVGYPHSPRWEEPDPGYLSAPTEVHFAVTNRCSMGCEGCYMAATQQYNHLPLQTVKDILTIFNEMGVFHVALGGGEAFERPDFGEIVEFCREIGLIPNLTTNGQKIGPHEVEICRQMGQVNISLDGVGENYQINGRRGSFQAVIEAIHNLKKAQVEVGLNCTVSAKNYSQLESVVAFAAKMKLNETEFLKYKPSGRGAASYQEYALTQSMIREFYPRLLKLSQKYSVELKIDCSFIPALVYHRPLKDDLEKLAVTGCDGGNLLLGVKADQNQLNKAIFSACSFISNNEPVTEIKTRWHNSTHLTAFRNWPKTAPEPCRSCDYLKICRGGCRAVALHLTGDFNSPDPECPVVYEWNLDADESGAENQIL